jgi:HK97 gp10 family phage protein
MGDVLGVKMEGGEEMLQVLADLGVNVKKTLRGSMRAGGKIIQADADARAPSSRAGKKAVLKVSSPKRGQVEARIQPSKRHWYLKFAETGTTAHEIKSSGAGKITFEGDEGLVRTGVVNHPGAPARPWLRPAFDSRSGEAVEVLGESLREAVEAAKIAAEGQDDED